MDSSGIDSAIEQLSKLLSLPHLTFPMKQKIQILQLDLQADEILQFIDYILMCLKDLFCLKADKIVVPVQKQIEAVEKKLRFSKIFAELVAKRGSKNDSKMEDFFIHFQDWAKNSACLSLLYWVDGMDENVRCSLMGEIVASFADAILENVVVFLKDDFATLREGVVFLIAFLVYPTKESATETGNVNDSLLKSLICSLYIYQTEDYSSKERNDLVHDFLEKVEKVKEEVREVYACMPNSSEEPNFPKTNGLDLLNYLTSYLSDMMNSKASFIPFAEHKLMAIHEELLCFRSSLQDSMNLQNDNDEG
ncbi:hypothetical protein ACH5RR_036492 [Cinchona calisaya]|uniref:Late blight resistance protein R1A-like N-terminal domain-containing protein n=1 Tax=Cinchona calisaya TaxID=153742 RepID=A0ABD2Y4L7_9GENT